MGANDREIERKYLLRSLPARTAGLTGAEIDQGYIPGDRIHERVRRVRDGAGVRYYRTVKLGDGVERFEFEDETTESFFAAVWPLTEGCRVRKRRFRLEAGEDLWEVDQFLDRDLVLAEIELDRADQEIEMPDFISSVLDREVTDEAEYANYRLARWRGT